MKQRLDDELVQAFAALDRAVPDGYFEEFGAKLDARLEDTVIEGSKRDAAGNGTSDEPGTGAAKKNGAAVEREENSGLHEIKALASSAKQRLSKQTGAQGAVADALVGTSSSSLSAVVLPDPKKAARPVEAPAASASPATSPAAGRRGGVPVWAFAAVVVAAAAGVVGFVVLHDRGGSNGGAPRDKVARNDEAPGQGAPAPAVHGSRATDEATAAATPTATAQPDVQAAQPTAGSAAAGEPATGADAAGAHAAIRKELEASRRGDATTGSASGHADHDGKAAAGATKADQHEGAKAAGDTTTTAAKGTGGNESVDDILDEVGGGEKKPADAKATPTAEAAKPAKKNLDSRDIRNAMDAIRSEAAGCFSVEQVSGTVSVHFVVDPSGKVSSASAEGKYKGTPTGNCVAQAVKGATFPAFDAKPLSFSFPFLLSE